MTADERIAHLEEQLKKALEHICLLQEQLAAAQKLIEELEKQKTPPPAFVKANVKKSQAEEKKPCKTRDGQHNHGRLRAVPTQIEDHRIVTCPDCHLRLGGISLARVREVIEVPPPPPVQVIHHRIFKGWCTTCQKWHEAPVDVQSEVLGQGRLGVRLLSLIATLSSVMRLPVRQIQVLLSPLHGLQINIGEISEVLARLVASAQPALSDLKAQLLASPAVQADETGWREDGQNGYIWSFSTPTIRYYEYSHSQSGEIVKQVMGEDFQGVLGSDFYGGYNVHQGMHQRCWVHFFRNIHTLKEERPHEEPLHTWANAVKEVYEQAVAWTAQGPDPNLPPPKQQHERTAQQHLFEQRLWALCQPYVDATVPQ
ncbi:MAG: IS66 family transposase, partial [Ktedonobacteraceae bacterium]